MDTHNIIAVDEEKMAAMTPWGRFCEVAYPQNLRALESHRSFIFKMQRYVGLYAAYVFHSLRISANLVDVLRVPVAVVAVSLLWEFRTNVWIAGFAVLLMYFQVFLDFVDGMVARLSGSMCFGGEFDGLPNELARAAIFILLGMYAENGVFVFISAAVASVLIGFLERTTARISVSGVEGLIKKIARRLLSVVFMLIVLPAVLVLCIGLHISLVIVSYALLGFYAFLAVVWLGICTVKK